MENSLSTPRFPNVNARMALAKRLNLAYLENMQDWEYEVADVARIEDLMKAYLCDEVVQEERFVLMEMLLESFTEIDNLENDSRWVVVLSWLEKNIHIHAHTICYWAHGDELLENSWNVTPFVRKIFDQYNLKVLAL